MKLKSILVVVLAALLISGFIAFFLGYYTAALILIGIFAIAAFGVGQFSAIESEEYLHRKYRHNDYTNRK